MVAISKIVDLLRTTELSPEEAERLKSIIAYFDQGGMVGVADSDISAKEWNALKNSPEFTEFMNKTFGHRSQSIKVSFTSRLNAIFRPAVTNRNTMVDGEKIRPDPVVQEMLIRLPEMIDYCLANEVESLPRNPHLEREMNAKIETLRHKEELIREVRGKGFYSSVDVQSKNGKTVQIGVLYSSNEMKKEAQQCMRNVWDSLPVLERFMGEPYPQSDIKIIYGFDTGSYNTGGEVHMEDRKTFEARNEAGAKYDSTVIHEMTHTYIGHESLNHFLELYVYNVATTGSEDVSAWVYTDGYISDNERNAGCAALLDIYRLVGSETMSRIYKKIYGLKPQYGEVLPDDAKKVFVDETPPELKERVATPLPKVNTNFNEK